LPRSRDVIAQQERLSTATWQVLADRGLAGLTVRAVAEQAGCTTGLVMHAFPDKRALLRHARRLLHQRTAARADRAHASTDDPRERLRAVLLQAVSLTGGTTEEARVWIAYTAAAIADDDLAQLHQEHNRAFLARIRQLVSATRSDLDGTALARAAIGLVALVEGLNTLAALDPTTYDADAQRAVIEQALAQLQL
jgi:AcrR family transcriptional regulator